MPTTSSPGGPRPRLPTSLRSLLLRLPRSARARRRGRDLLLALLVGWTAHGFYFEAAAARDGWRLHRLPGPSSDRWRLGAAQPERLRRCLVGMEPTLPAGIVYLWDPATDLYRWRWACYFLPGREVRAAGPTAPSGLLVIATTRRGPPGGQLVRGGSWCGVYRLP